MPETTTQATSTSYGSLDVTVLGAQNLKTSSGLRILRVLCVVECAGARFKTKSARARANPTWNASGSLAFDRFVSLDEEVRVSVWDKRGDGHKCMGSGAFALGTTRAGEREPRTLELAGGKYSGGRVSLIVKYDRNAIAEARAPEERREEASEPGDVPEDGETVTSAVETVRAAAVEETEVKGSGVDGLDVSFASDASAILVVDTEMTPLDANDAVAREEEEEEDEWSAVLKPMKPARRERAAERESEEETSIEVQKAIRDSMRKVRGDAGRIAEIWAEQSTDDVVVVTPPPMPANPRHIERDADENEAQRKMREVEADVLTVRHVVTPVRPGIGRYVDAPVAQTSVDGASGSTKVQPLEEPRAHEAQAVAEMVTHPAPAAGETVVPTSPNASAKTKGQTSSNTKSSPRRALRIETEEDLVAALLSPTRLSSPRVTFDERIVRPIPVPAQASTPIVQAVVMPNTPKSASRNAGAPRTPPAQAKRLFDPPAPAGIADETNPTKAEIEEAKRLAVMFERAEAVFASWSW